MLQKQFNIEKKTEGKKNTIVQKHLLLPLLPLGRGVGRRSEALAAPAAVHARVREDERRPHLVLDPVHRGADDVHQRPGVHEDLDGRRRRRRGRRGRRGSAAGSATAAPGCRFAPGRPPEPDLDDLVEPRGRVCVVERVGQAVAAAALDAQAEVLLFWERRLERERERERGEREGGEKSEVFEVEVQRFV